MSIPLFVTSFIQPKAPEIPYTITTKTTSDSNIKRNKEEKHNKCSSPKPPPFIIMVDTYRAILVKFMSYMNDQEYENDYDFSNEELGAIKPSDVKRYMEKRAYGVENPPDHVNPNLARSTSVEFWKKAISYYMPNKLMAWNALAQQGNPTRSIEVNEVIKKMKKKEVRKQGKNSKARRGLKQEEFLFLLELSKASEDPVEKYGYPGFFIVEYSLIARIDCTSQFLAENLTTSSDFDFVLRGRLSWSKNVNEERDAPNQILIGAMDQNYCTLLGLAVALEVAMDAVDEGGLSPYVFGFSATSID